MAAATSDPQTLTGAAAGLPSSRLAWPRRHEAALVTTVSLVVFIGVWQAIAMFARLGPSVFAGPGPVFEALATLTASGELMIALASTGTIFFAGFLLAALVGIMSGLLLGSSENLEAILSPYVMALYAAPRVAFISLLLVWFKTGATSKIALIFLSAVFPILLNTLTGARAVDPVLLRTARAFGARRGEIFRKVVVPFSVPFILAGLRLGVGRALIGAFVAEMFGTSAGIGSLIIRAGYEFHAATLLAGILVLAACSVLMTEGLRWMGGRLTPWRPQVVL